MYFEKHRNINTMSLWTRRLIAMVIDITIAITIAIPISIFIWWILAFIFFLMLSTTSLFLSFASGIVLAQITTPILSLFLYINSCANAMGSKNKQTIGQIFMRLQYEVKPIIKRKQKIIAVLFNISPILFFLIMAKLMHCCDSLIMPIDLNFINSYRGLFTNKLQNGELNLVIWQIIGSLVLILVNIIYGKRIDSLIGIKVINKSTVSTKLQE